MNLRESKKERQLRAAAQNRQRFQKVLMILLASSVPDSDNFNRLRGFVRNFDLKRMYEWAESASAVAYGTAAEHYAANQLAALILKAPFGWKDFDFEMNPRERAIEKFDSAEERCRKTNIRFQKFIRRVMNAQIGHEQSWFDRKVFEMRGFIRRVLGDKPDLSSIFEKAGYGPGASVGVHGNATNIYRKFFTENWSVTPTCIPYAKGALLHNFSLFEALCEERDGIVCYDREVAAKRFSEKIRMVTANSVSFVPKTAKTERSIAVEPLLNSFVQKGIDSEMRDKLRRFGYNLEDQGRNSEMARVGSLDGSLFTLDLSSASDTVSVMLCKALLPEEWYDLLNRTRSPAYTLSGKVETYQKFTSMGNGFCFPLETLIFAAAVKAVLPDEDRRHTVYGDDIIAPTACYQDLIRLLKFCGFTPNETKSFAEGPFRESCGADWYEGQDVRPVYLDYPLTSTSELMVFHNATLRSERVADFFTEVRPFLRSCVPERERFLRRRGLSNNSLPHWRKRIRLPGETPHGDSTGWWGRARSDRLEVYNLNGAFDVESDAFMAAKSVRWNKDQQRWSWKEFVYQPIQDHAEGPDYNRARYWSFLLGSPGGEVYLRRKTRRLIIVR